MCLLVGLAWAAVLPDQFSDELESASYNCILTLVPAANLSRKATVRLTLEAGDGAACTVITLTKGQLTITPVGAGRNSKRIELAAGVAPGEPYHLTVMRRGEWLALRRGDQVIYRGVVPRPAGTAAGLTLGKGWTVAETRVQPLEPVVFSDNFMRTADESGGWTARSGSWALQSAWDLDPKGNANRFNNTVYAQNPFAWVGHPAGETPALCTAGQPIWEDYTLAVAVCPATGGAAGVAVNVVDAQNLLLVRWTPGNDRGPGGNRLTLYQVTDGKRKALAESSGGYIPGQWYRLQVVTNLSGVAVLVDGQVRLTAREVTPWRGGVGLYAEGKVGSVFDDVSVYGSALKTDLLYENQQMYINKRFLEDKNGMQEWSTSRVDWVDIPGAPNHKVHVDGFYGDYWITLTVKLSPAKAGELWLTVDGNGADLLAGYRALLVQAPDEMLAVTILRGADVLATKKCDPLTPNEEYTLRLRRQGKTIRLELDGETLLEAVDPKPLSGTRPGYFGSGCFAEMKDILATGRNVLDYTFAEAPVDWLQEGTWMPTTRWSCAPHWSFLGGWSHGDAVLWHKQRFTGDQSLETFIGLKMEYPRERAIYDYRYRDFAVTICGDGHDPRTGYTGIYGAPDEQNNPNRRTVLLRNGVIVGSVNLSVPGRGASHREWFQLMLRKSGKTVELWVEGKKQITFTDPQPLAGGVPAIWAKDNGIALARARLIYAAAPQPRTDPRVILDEPWYPEWANVGQPLALDFPNAWSTTARKVSLKVTPRENPAGDESAVAADALRATFLPRQQGPHWYQLAASDGEHESPAFHLVLPVFDPALGRDDSRAQVLYRFDTPGAVIRDVSGKTPALDIPVPKDAPVEWQPGQGLTLHGQVNLTTADPADRLLSLLDGGAFTIEAWISTDTLYPPSSWSGTLVSLENGPETAPFASRGINLQLVHRSQSLVYVGRGDTGAVRQVISGGFRTGLQHYVVAWDGKTAVTYLNGQQLVSNPFPAAVLKWLPNTRLILGSSLNGQSYYLGSYYLLALHNACLPPDQIQRHYKAGPSAR